MDRVFKTLRGEAALNEWHIDNALKEIRVALLGSPAIGVRPFVFVRNTKL